MGIVKLKRRRGAKAAYIEHVGPYETVPFDQHIGRLYAWAKQNRLKPGLRPFTIHPDDPNITPKSQLRSWVAITVSGDAKPGNGVMLLGMRESPVASLNHEAPASEYGNSYRVLAEWIAAEGLEIAGPPAEFYYRKPVSTDGQTIIYADIQFPVRKK